MFPVATEPMTLICKIGRPCSPRKNKCGRQHRLQHRPQDRRGRKLASEGVVAVLTALFVTFRLITPARPPLAKPAPNPAAPLFPPPPLALTCRVAAASAAKVMAGKVLKAADALGRNHGLGQHTAAGVSYIDTQVAMNESIFCDTFKKPIAHMNQIRTLPETASLPTASTWLALLPQRWQRPAGRTGRIGLQPSARGTKFS